MSRIALLFFAQLQVYDPSDSQSYPKELPDYTGCLVSDISGITVGVPKEFLEEGLSDTVKGRIYEGLR